MVQALFERGTFQAQRHRPDRRAAPVRGARPRRAGRQRRADALLLRLQGNAVAGDDLGRHGRRQRAALAGLAADARRARAAARELGQPDHAGGAAADADRAARSGHRLGRARRFDRRRSSICSLAMFAALHWIGALGVTPEATLASRALVPLRADRHRRHDLRRGRAHAQRRRTRARLAHDRRQVRAQRREPAGKSRSADRVGLKARFSDYDQLFRAGSPFRESQPCSAMLSILMPAYNEASSIAENVCETVETMHALGINFEIVVIDDGSLDGTDAAASNALRAWPDTSASSAAPATRARATRLFAARRIRGATTSPFSMPTWTCIRSSSRASSR